MPETARDACDLYRLPSNPTRSDLEIGYATRGAQLVECEAKRRLAVETADAEHKLEDRWLADRERRRRPWWRPW